VVVRLRQSAGWDENNVGDGIDTGHDHSGDLETAGDLAADQCEPDAGFGAVEGDGGGRDLAR
jgi:hypothetical protein